MDLGRVPVAVIGAVLMLCLNCGSHADDTSSSLPDLWVTHEVTQSISIGGQLVGNIVIGVLFNSAPRTVYNFLIISYGNTTNAYGVHLTYKGSRYHRTIPRFMIQGGDIENKNGQGSASVYGGDFPDENFDIPHYGAGWVGMANAGPDTNGCQIYITCAPTPWLDNHHTIFGKIVGGMDVVHLIENNPTTTNDRPIKDVIIEDTWVTVVDQPYTVTRAPVDG